MLVQRLPVDPRKMFVRLAVGPREKRGQFFGVVGHLEDLRVDPVGLDQRYVVQQRADAIERSFWIPIDHLWSDVLELTERVAAAVFESSQPTAHLRVVSDRLESQALLHRGKPTDSRDCHGYT